MLIAAQLRPAVVADPGLTAVPSAETAAASSDQGVYVPAIELPEAEPGVAMDMIACVVYEGTVYTQGEWLDDASALVGEYLGPAGRIPRPRDGRHRRVVGRVRIR